MTFNEPTFIEFLLDHAPNLLTLLAGAAAATALVWLMATD